MEESNALHRERDAIHEALITFSDFIYAVVFVLIVQQSFDEVIDSNTLGASEQIVRLLLFGAIFYFLVWDCFKALLPFSPKSVFPHSTR